MSDAASSRAPVAGAGVICFRGVEVLLVKRGKAPSAGRWSIPGGRIEWGERAADAALRELMEETGCAAELVGLVDVVDALIPHSGAETDDGPAAHFVLADYAARWISGEPRAGDDASEARFFFPEDLADLGLWSETLRVIDAARAMVTAR